MFFPSPNDASHHRSFRSGGAYPIDAEAVWGDVWLTVENGSLRWWWTSPVECLPPPAISLDTITFDLAKLCWFKKPGRLVAVVYDEKRSAFIRDMPIPDLEGMDPDSPVPTDRWVLVDTMSPFVKHVWSPIFQLPPKPQE